MHYLFIFYITFHLLHSTIDVCNTIHIIMRYRAIPIVYSLYRIGLLRGKAGELISVAVNHGDLD